MDWSLSRFCTTGRFCQYMAPYRPTFKANLWRCVTSNTNRTRLGRAIPHILKGMGNYSPLFPLLGEWRGMGEWVYFEMY